MYCGKCGNGNIKPIHQEIEQDGDQIIVSDYGQCDVCGELLGDVFYYKMTGDDYISPQRVEEVLTAVKKSGLNSPKKIYIYWNKNTVFRSFEELKEECINTGYVTSFNEFLEGSYCCEEIFYFTEELRKEVFAEYMESIEEEVADWVSSYCDVIEV